MKKCIVKISTFVKPKKDQISNGMIVVKNQQLQSTVNLSDVTVLTVLLSVPLDGDHKVDGRSNAKPTIPGRIQDFLLASRVQISPMKSLKSMLKPKASSERISQSPNFSVASLLTSF